MIWVICNVSTKVENSFNRGKEETKLEEGLEMQNKHRYPAHPIYTKILQDMLANMLQYL